MSMIKPSEQAAREYSYKNHSPVDHGLVQITHFSGQQHILDTLAEMAREHEKEIKEEAIRQYCMTTSNKEIFKDGAHFGFTLGQASMQGEIKKLRDRPTDGEYKNRYHKQKEWEVLMRDKLTQRDATIKSLNEMVEVMHEAITAMRCWIPVRKEAWNISVEALTKISELRKKL